MASHRGYARRDVLGLFAGAGSLSIAGCSGADGDPSLAVPRSALTDEPISVEVNGLEPRSSVVVRASANARDGTEWEARARFEADDTGTVVVSERAPVEGSYEAADSMGLFWSKRPADAPPRKPLAPAAAFAPPERGYDVELTAEVDGEMVAEATTTRRLFDLDIRRQPVESDGLVGEFFAPPGDDPAPGVVHLHGAGGKPHLATGRLLASRGFATLTLRYFGDPEPIPNTLAEVPVEYVETAMEWLRNRDRVAGPDVGLFGFSRGGPLALLAASHFDGVGAVVGWVPSGIAWEGLGYGRTPAGTSAWSLGGEPVPFLELADADPGPPPAPALPYYEPALSNASEDELAAATVPVENADAPIYLVSVTDDRRWPSTRLSERVVSRLDAAGYAREYRHDAHPGAGHYLRFPYLPTAGTARDRYNVYGGDQVANARACEAAWSETLSFLGDALGNRLPSVAFPDQKT